MGDLAMSADLIYCCGLRLKLSVSNCDLNSKIEVSSLLQEVSPFVLEAMFLIVQKMRVDSAMFQKDKTAEVNMRQDCLESLEEELPILESQIVSISKDPL